MKLVIITVFSFFFSGLAQAEYRAYELLLTSAETGKERKIITTMDQYQYAQYYHLNRDQSLSYVTSWMCWENTSHRAICDRPEPAPLVETETRAPADISQ